MNIILLVNDQYDGQVFESEDKSIEHDHENGNFLTKSILLFEVLFVCYDLFIIFIWLILIRRRIIRIIRTIIRQ